MSHTATEKTIPPYISRLLWVGAVLYTLLLTYLVLTPHPLWFLGGPGEETEEIVDQTLADYIQHALAYGVLSFALVVAASFGKGPRVSSCLLFAVLHGSVCEVLQHFIPDRYFGVYDGLANIIGVAAGGLVATFSVWLVQNWLGFRPETADLKTRSHSSEEIHAAVE